MINIVHDMDELAFTDWQIADATKMASHSAFLQASEMATGKSAITLLATAMKVKRDTSFNLILCPANAVPVWHAELGKWWRPDNRFMIETHVRSPMGSTRIHTDHRGGKQSVATQWSTLSTDKERVFIVSRYLEFQDLGNENHHFIVLNYEQMLNDDVWHDLNEVDFDVVIYDEAHRMANPETLHAKKGYRLFPKRAAFALTGTPVISGYHNLYPFAARYLTDKVKAVTGGVSYQAWCNHFVDIDHKQIDGRMVEYIKNNKAPDDLKRIYTGSIIRRRTKDVWPQLEYREANLPLTIGNPTIDKNPGRSNWDAFDSIEQLIDDQGGDEIVQRNRGATRLGPALAAWFKEKSDHGELDGKYVVFCRYHNTMDAFIKGLTGVKGLTTGKISGNEHQKWRRRAIECFQDPKNKLNVLVCSITATDTAVDFTAAHTVIMLEPMGSPSRNDQAIKRCVRPAQKKLVSVLWPYLVGDGRFERIAYLREQRRKQYQKFDNFAEQETTDES